MHKVRWLLVVLLGGLLLFTSRTAVAANPPAAGEVLINEFVAAPSSGPEWIELYNTTGNDLDISGHYIDDVGGGGGSPRVIPASTIITAGGYYVLETTGLLNNSGDEVRFLDPAQTTVLDSTTYGGAESDHSWYRYRDGLDWSPAESEDITKGTSNDPMSPDAWTSGNFEIHIFDVEQGDSQLIIFPSGYSILIDVVEHSYASDKGAALVASKIQAILGTDTIDVGVLSHHHLDHIGYAGYGGFWGLIETYGISFDLVVDRDAGAWVDGLDSSTPDGLCDANTEIEWHNAGTVSGTSRNWLCYATNSANTNIYNVRELADIGSTTQIDPPDSGALVQIVQADAEDIYMADGTTPLTGDNTGMSTPPSENDYSIALYIRYGDIEYATAGDSDGEYDTSSFGYTYNDVETL
ncbi:MAG: lamin tail domain-containing protein, partial [Anaerolineales bacterium]|nr:lamin tail domain-containing protein [Anaerolineales bacterium]